jgi:hypothetical protein
VTPATCDAGLQPMRLQSIGERRRVPSIGGPRMPQQTVRFRVLSNALTGIAFWAADR